MFFYKLTGFLEDHISQLVDHSVLFRYRNEKIRRYQLIVYVNYSCKRLSSLNFSGLAADDRLKKDFYGIMLYGIFKRSLNISELGTRFQHFPAKYHDFIISVMRSLFKSV